MSEICIREGNPVSVVVGNGEPQILVAEVAEHAVRLRDEKSGEVKVAFYREKNQTGGAVGSVLVNNVIPIRRGAILSEIRMASVTQI